MFLTEGRGRWRGGEGEGEAERHFSSAHLRTAVFSPLNAKHSPLNVQEREERLHARLTGGFQHVLKKKLLVVFCVVRGGRGGSKHFYANI